MASSSDETKDSLIRNDELDSIDDAELLDIVTPSQFQALCEQCGISADGTPEELLQRLRNHASQVAAVEARRRTELQERVERGVNDDERERHEILGDLQGGDDEADDEGFFYFNLPTDETEKKEPTTAEIKAMANDFNKEQSSTPPQPKRKEPTKYKPANYVTQSDVLASPPPPPETATVDEDGNRVVTVYSTTDHNDLTGVAAAQPGTAALSGTDPMAAGSSLGVTGNTQPWDMEGPQQTTKSATTRELEEAKNKVTQLVQSLLAMSGAPAFRDFDLPEELDFNTDDDDDEGSASRNSYTPSHSNLPGYGTNSNGYIHPPSDQELFVGFDPSKVPTHILTEASPALRANRGQVLQEVLREFELHSVGQDGMAGDSMEDGGGHFRECAKVRAFLEGYRRAEVRKAARSTVTFLLDKLVSEGVDGLDLSLSTMSRSNDDSASTEDAFELNDSLIDYLNDIIREQEKKVDQLVGGMDDKPLQTGSLVHGSDTDDDAISLLWNQTEGENGEMIESIDPQDPQIQRVLQDEYEKAERQQEQETLTAVGRKTSIPETAPEKMLLLLTLLRERIKTEAAFANDERRRNLKVLAYCLQCKSAADREELILKDLGGSIDVSNELFSVLWMGTGMRCYVW